MIVKEIAYVSHMGPTQHVDLKLPPRTLSRYIRDNDRVAVSDNIEWVRDHVFSPNFIV